LVGAAWGAGRQGSIDRLVDQPNRSFGEHVHVHHALDQKLQADAAATAVFKHCSVHQDSDDETGEVNDE
jgi:hypothetical protein